MLRLTLTAGTAALAAVLIGAGPALAAGGWTVAPAPPTGQDAYINGIAARTDTDAWAVGSVGQQSSPGATIVWAAGYSGVSGSFNPLTLRNG